MILLSPFTTLEPRPELRVAPTDVLRPWELAADPPVVTWRSLLVFIALGLLAGAAFAAFERAAAPPRVAPPAASHRMLAI